ncbi:DUF2306 domain-containing protein [Longispora sp. K20-0274]|uniref:DUF2306 domain-containing protein n=1 Tax=Longispora sp. K20-0274 TaxID=3088255 RepID=UPI00399B8161
MSPQSTSNATTLRRDWLVPALLIALTLVPMIAGTARITELAAGAAATPDNARFVATPGPVVAHIVAATLYCLFGAWQFSHGLRRRRPGWHRISGRLLVPLGLAAALSGLWMTVYYPDAPGDGALLAGIRLVVGTAMVGSIVLGLAAILRRDIRRHQAWMTRGYAIGLGAGTQVLTHVPWLLVFGTPGTTTRALLMAAGWVINVVVAEWFLRRRPARAVPVRVGAAVGR